jgi:hypothetical protein
MRNAFFDSVLRRRQRLSEYLAAKNLGTANVATVAAKDILLDSLELQKCDEVLQYWVHGG